MENKTTGAIISVTGRPEGAGPFYQLSEIFESSLFSNDLITAFFLSLQTSGARKSVV